MIRKLRQAVLKVIKNTNMIKQEIDAIKSEKVTAPVLVTANLNNVLRYERFIEQDREKVAHLRETIRKIQIQANRSLVPRKKNFRQLTPLEENLVKQLEGTASSLVSEIR